MTYIFVLMQNDTYVAEFVIDVLSTLPSWYYTWNTIDD